MPGPNGEAGTYLTDVVGEGLQVNSATGKIELTLEVQELLRQLQILLDKQEGKV